MLEVRSLGVTESDIDLRIRAGDESSGEPDRMVVLYRLAVVFADRLARRGGVIRRNLRPEYGLN
jgi:hypothetical protein